MRTATLEGAQLAQWVALALEYMVKRDGCGASAELIVILPDGGVRSFGEHGWRPDKDWAVAGPIIDHDKIALQWLGSDLGWFAGHCRGPGPGVADGRGPTALAAAMRAVVAGRFGAEVPDA